jgi:hypothetical protein
MTCMKNPFRLLVLIVGLGSVLVGPVTAQTFAVLHSFAEGGYNDLGFVTNSDGNKPDAGLILSGNMVYGTALYGGSSSNRSLTGNRTT